MMSAGAVTLVAASDLPLRDNGLNSAIAAEAEVVRKPAIMLSVSDELKKALIEEEGVKYTVYADVAGNPTVGVGHLVKPADNLSFGQTIDRDRALNLFDDDLAIAEAAVVRLAGELPLHQHEFDALVDLAFNVGEGGISPRKSPMLNASVADGDYSAIAAELDYTTAGGAIANGLVHRSERRADIFVDAEYANPRGA